MCKLIYSTYTRPLKRISLCYFCDFLCNHITLLFCIFLYVCYVKMLLTLIGYPIIYYHSSLYIIAFLQVSSKSIISPLAYIKTKSNYFFYYITLYSICITNIRFPSHFLLAYRNELIYSL